MSLVVMLLVIVVMVIGVSFFVEPVNNKASNQLRRGAVIGPFLVAWWLIRQVLSALYHIWRWAWWHAIHQQEPPPRRRPNR
jgi:heme/copper-type cytochrome/quinol oxidase subunit 2